MHCCCAISVNIFLDHWHGSELNDLWKEEKTVNKTGRAAEQCHQPQINSGKAALEM